MKLIETRIIDTAKVRAMCIKNDYYTNGTVEEYNRMFNKCDLNFGILEIAQDIMEHCDKEKFLYAYGGTEAEFLEAICYNIINDCCYTCVEIEQ